MDRLKGIIKKEFYHIFRDKRTLLILFGIPIVQIVLFGFAISTEIKEVKIALLNQANDEASHTLVDKILSTSYFQVDELIQNEAGINESFKKGKIKAALVIPPNFESDIRKNNTANIQIICDASDPNTGTQIGAYLEGQIQGFIYGNAQKSKGIRPPIQINTEIQMRYNPELKSAYSFVPGLITIILMLICTMMTSIAITREIETGTMEVLLASPMHPATIILGKVIPYLALSFTIAIFILFLGKFVFGVPILAHFGLLIFEILLYCLVVLALGIFISTIAKTQQLALMISLFALFLPTMLLSGFIFPIHNMPLPLQMVTKVIPATYFNIIIKALMLKGATLAEIWKETAILGGIFIFLVGVSIKRFNIRLG
ncbi:ABC transporter permease [Flammeovirga yaeyamensis]|uniref:Transport permease protein n=1 Tax=Flammeovirga yaeyamensis TaxID=367791 RepID=A0AAX1N3N2_9BACT|nr:ABC transporter permease [Flammeovirga yaeyamensis]MBB3696064.1 ABC-2 type transport system permease protein [Flammeovirga yaeyamensis]NMF34749.1 ABC transporter permease [Flammeovirga yaeyamensis]QWG00423.1 ABC transporter permease [Flammeovirga yaeyamensis]